MADFSTHMPLARHDPLLYHFYPAEQFSTHMPLARHDRSLTGCWIGRYGFLLTCLLRGMTIGLDIIISTRIFSTHMPLARHDVFMGHSDYNVTFSTHMPLARHDMVRRRY